jgi:hypothetical protein
MASLRKRNGVYYAQYYFGRKQTRISLRTESLQIAKEKIRQVESAFARGDDNPLPTRTFIADVVAAYVRHIRTIKTAKSAQTDTYCLCEAFGPVCDEVSSTVRRARTRWRSEAMRISQ